MEQTKLKRAKEVIKENFSDARCGIFDCPSLCGWEGQMCLYKESGLEILINYHYEYFEVFGLSKEEFAELEAFYENMMEGSEE